MKKIIISLTLCLSFVFVISNTFAQVKTGTAYGVPPISGGNILPGPKIENPEDFATGMQYLSERFIPALASGFTMVLLVIGIAMLIVAGYFFIFSSGDSEQKEKAKNIMIWTIVGVVIAMLSVTIVKFIIGLDIDVTP